MAASRKKAILRRFSREWISGYADAEQCCVAQRVEILDLSGKVVLVAAEEVKWLCFVRDFNSGEINNPERLLRKTFAGRPRGEGLVLRVRLTDGDVLEGITPNDRSLIGGSGVFLLPPDTRSNTQRLWLPYSAIAELEVLAVLGAARRKPAVPQPDLLAKDDQPELFH